MLLHSENKTENYGVFNRELKGNQIYIWGCQTENTTTSYEQ